MFVHKPDPEISPYLDHTSGMTADLLPTHVPSLPSLPPPLLPSLLNTPYALSTFS